MASEVKPLPSHHPLSSLDPKSKINRITPLIQDQPNHPWEGEEEGGWEREKEGERNRGRAKGSGREMGKEGEGEGAGGGERSKDHTPAVPQKG